MLNKNGDMNFYSTGTNRIIIDKMTNIFVPNFTKVRRGNPNTPGYRKA